MTTLALARWRRTAAVRPRAPPPRTAITWPATWERADGDLPGTPGERSAAAAVAVVVDDEGAADVLGVETGTGARKGRRRTVVLKMRSSRARMGVREGGIVERKGRRAGASEGGREVVAGAAARLAEDRRKLQRRGAEAFLLKC
jgi:hypothetical protein